IGTVGMCLVLLMGATVTDTGSGEGCGRSWPLCHGNFLPEQVRESVIEFSHRAVTGVLGFVILFLSIGAIRARKQLPQLVPLVPLMAGSLLLQSGMGAWAVKYPQSAPVLALHFGFSLVAVAGVFLVLRVIDEQRNQQRQWKRPAPRALVFSLWASVVVVYVVAYSGAYIKHAEAVDACRSWPLCDGQVWPGLSGDDGVIFMHRLAALGSVLLVAGIAWLAWRHRDERPDLYNISMLALLVIVCQAIVGAIVAASDMQLSATLLHAGLMTALFLTLCEGCRLTVPARAERHVWASSPHGTATSQPAD
ncbi:MAG: COX15/CtaA family protein, partial [Chloroflexota bacterium]|nr:COX15/CtaA family protein [Chloroflexota bacterium]